MSGKIGNAEAADDNEYPLWSEELEIQASIFFKWYGNEKAMKIASSTSMSKSEKIAALRKLIFADVDELEKAGAEGISV